MKLEKQKTVQIKIQNHPKAQPKKQEGNEERKKKGGYMPI